MQYTIIRIYQVPASTQHEATDRFQEAVRLGVERDFHVRDYVRGEREAARRDVPRPSWWTLIRRQLVGS